MLVVLLLERRWDDLLGDTPALFILFVPSENGIERREKEEWEKRYKSGCEEVKGRTMMTRV